MMKNIKTLLKYLVLKVSVSQTKNGSSEKNGPKDLERPGCSPKLPGQRALMRMEAVSSSYSLLCGTPPEVSVWLSGSLIIDPLHVSTQSSVLRIPYAF